MLKNLKTLEEIENEIKAEISKANAIYKDYNLAVEETLSLINNFTERVKGRKNL